MPEQPPPTILRDPQFGRGAPTLGWVPAPRYLLRRDVVLRRASELPRGAVLEIGCGAGSLLADLHALGFRCEAVETSAAARTLAAKMLADLPDITIHDAIHPGLRERFDLLLAFEVLEHIEDDTAALREWVTFLRPGGRVLLSVPAHAKRWTASDTWAGHFRRYDRSHFTALAERAGLRVTQCVNYGFPLANVVEPMKAFVAARELAEAKRADGGAEPAFKAARTAESGVHRNAETRLYPLLASMPGRLLMRAASRMQHWFSATELGNGFVLEAVKP